MRPCCGRGRSSGRRRTLYGRRRGNRARRISYAPQLLESGHMGEELGMVRRGLPAGRTAALGGGADERERRDKENRDAFVKL